MNRFLGDVRNTLSPAASTKDGPLPPLLVTLTFVTGLVDAFSYLVLGHVFVANMTGNVVFLGFALAGAPGFSLGASLVAVASFIAGAFVGGLTGRRFATHRGHLLGAATSIQAILLGVAVILAAVADTRITSGFRYGLIVLLAVAMGLQNAAVRRLAVPELTTTVLTMTMTGIAADGPMAGGTGSKAGRRLIAILAMFLGALVGAVSVLHVRLVMPLLIAFAVLCAVSAAASILGRPRPDWIVP